MLLLRLSYLDRTLELEALLQGLGGEAPAPLEVSRTAQKDEAPRPKPSASPSIEDCWERLLAEPSVLPRGVLPFLKAATVEFPTPTEVKLSVLPGPGLERLQDPTVVVRLKEALSKHLGSGAGFSAEAADTGEGANQRITEGMVRGGRLRELVDKEPTLGEAVEELDLELLD
jgi:hypothetical protein